MVLISWKILSDLVLGVSHDIKKVRIRFLLGVEDTGGVKQ